MRSAPPVLVPVGRFVWGERMTVLLSVGTLLAGLLWLWQMDAQASAVMAALLAWCAVAVASAWVLRRQTWPAGQLRWDGEAWWFESARDASPGQSVHVQAVWDGGSAMCLRLQAVDGVSPHAYAWLRARDMPTAWHSVRCAVYQQDTL